MFDVVLGELTELSCPYLASDMYAGPFFLSLPLRNHMYTFLCMHEKHLPILLADIFVRTGDQKCHSHLAEREKVSHFSAFFQCHFVLINCASNDILEGAYIHTNIINS